MQKKLWIRIATLFVILGLVCTVSCRKKVEPLPPEEPVEVAVEEEPAVDEAALQREAEEAERRRMMEEERLAQEEAKENFISEVVYFAFDSSVIDSDGQRILNAKAEWMNKNPQLSVVIEGHCDEKGTADYNLALGDRRANAVKSYMMDLGISASKMATISYGEERPADPMNDAKNRRAKFVIE